MSKALSARYRWGFQNLFNTLGPNHPRLTEVRILQQHFIEAINDPAARDDILRHANQLSLELTEQSLEDFCNLDIGVSIPTAEPAPPDKDEEILPATYDEYVAWLQPLLDQDRLKLPMVRKTVQARTLQILPNLHPTHKGQVVLFLYELGLLFMASYSLSLVQADLSNIHLAEADLGGINLSEANMTGANLVGATLTQATLTLTNLTGANLGWGILPGANLAQAELAGAIMTGADLRMADLTNAHLVKAMLRQADMTQSQLAEVNLLGASLEGAILTQANLSMANLLWTDLSRARLDGAIFEGATYNHHTRWPADFDPTPRGAITID